MSSLKKKVFLSGIGAAMSASAALAADLPAPPIIEYEPQAPIEIGSTWYLRGDAGLAVYTGGDASWMTSGGALRKQYGASHELGWVAGLGVGYYINDYFRADLTLDYRHKHEYEGKSDCSPHPCYNQDTHSFSAWTLFLNGYYDFGSYHSVTPYVGAGIGVARLTTSDHKTTGTLLFKDKTQYNFAWNVMAGASFQVAQDMHFDANYRFVSLGKSKTGGPASGASENPVKFDNLYAHDFRVGLRYDLN